MLLPIALSTFPDIISINFYKYSYLHLKTEKTEMLGFFQDHLGREGMEKIKHCSSDLQQTNKKDTFNLCIFCISWNIKETNWLLKLCRAVNLDVFI